MARRKLYLLSRNPYKYAEYRSFFSQYNIEVIVLNDFKPFDTIASLVERYRDLSLERKVVAVVSDITELFDSQTNKRISPLTENENLSTVYTKTTLYYLQKGKLDTITSSPHQGIIDFSARANKKKVFGWDDVFILKAVGLSYHELKKRGLKNHCRQEALALFAANYLHYNDKIDLNFNRLAQQEEIEFSDKIFDFIRQNNYINSPSVRQDGLQRLFQYALRNGGFFRSSSNRRQKNYWVPGLNAGIPLTPKKDPIHEITFFVHDLCHFVLPDLIFDGGSTRLHQRVYIITRMMSEAFTLVFADMIFIHALVMDGVEYDFGKRKIYPLYQAILKNSPTVSLKELLYANVRYCLLGDSSFYEKYIGEDIHSLLNFQQKYEPFFIEDYRWTKRNFERMQTNATIFKQWYTENKTIFEEQGLLGVQTFTHKILGLGQKEKMATDLLVDCIFDDVYQRFQTILDTANTYPRTNALSDSFKKYMLGQLLLFYKIDSVPYGHRVKKIIQRQLQKPIIDTIHIQKIRHLYHDYLHELEATYHLINKDDVATYRAVYPIFDSFYVFYEKKQTTQMDLQTIAKEILS